MPPEFGNGIEDQAEEEKNQDRDLRNHYPFGTEQYSIFQEILEMTQKLKSNLKK